MNARAMLFPLLSLFAVPAVAAQFPGAPGPSGPQDAAVASPGPSGPNGRTARANQAESVLRRYPLAGLLPEVGVQDHQIPLFTTPYVTGGYEYTPLGANALRAEFQADIVADLIAQALDDDLRFEGRALELGEGPTLVLLAPEAVHAKARAVLDGIGQVLGARAVVTVDVLTSSDRPLAFPPSALVSDQQAEQLVSSAASAGAEHVRHELSVSSGRLAVSDQTRRLEIVADYDVEIAQASAIWDPITVSQAVGQRIVLTGSVVGGGLELAGVVSTSELVGDVQPRALDAAMLLTNERTGVSYGEGPQVIEQAEIAASAYAFRGVVGNGRALVCASETMTRGKRRSQIVVLRATEVRGTATSKTAVGGAGRTLMVIDTNAQASSRLATFSYYDDFNGTEFLDDAAPYMFAEFRSDVPGVLFDFLDYRYNVGLEYGPYRMVLSDPSWDRSTAEDLERFLAAWPAAEAGKSLHLELRTSGRAEGVPSRALVPALPGLPSSVVIGTSRNMLFDYDVEVAQHSAVADPTVAQFFAGLGAIVTPQVGPEGSMELRAEAFGSVPDGPPSVLEVEAIEFRYFDRQDRDLLLVDDRRTLAEDGTASFGASGRGTDRQVLQLRATVQ